MDDYLFNISDGVAMGVVVSFSLLLLYVLVDFLCSLYFRKKDK